MIIAKIIPLNIEYFNGRVKTGSGNILITFLDKCSNTHALTYSIINLDFLIKTFESKKYLNSQHILSQNIFHYKLVQITSYYSFYLGIFLINHLEFVRKTGGIHPFHLPYRITHLIRTQAILFHHIQLRKVFSHLTASHHHRSPAHHGRVHQAKRVLDQRQLKDVATDQTLLLVCLHPVQKFLEIVDPCHNSQIKRQHQNNFALHVQDLMVPVDSPHMGPVFFQLWSFYLLVFGSHEKRGQTQQLVPFLGNIPFLAEFVQDPHRQKQRLIPNADPTGNPHHPAHQLLPHPTLQLHRPGHKILLDEAVLPLPPRALPQILPNRIHLRQFFNPIVTPNFLNSLGPLSPPAFPNSLVCVGDVPAK